MRLLSRSGSHINASFDTVHDNQPHGTCSPNESSKLKLFERWRIDTGKDLPSHRIAFRMFRIILFYSWYYYTVLFQIFQKLLSSKQKAMESILRFSKIVRKGRSESEKKKKKKKKSKSEHLESIAIVRDSRCSRGDGTNRVIGHALATRATDKAPTRPIIGEFRTIGYHMYLSLRCVNACVTHTRTSSMFPLRVFCTKDNDTHEDRRRVAKLHEILL